MAASARRGQHQPNLSHCARTLSCRLSLKEAYVTFNSKQCTRRDPLYDVNPLTGVRFEVFYSDRTLETFGKGGASWFWWPRERGCPPAGPPTGPFPTSYSAYRSAMNTAAQSPPGEARHTLAHRVG